MDTFLSLGLAHWVHSSTVYSSTNTLDLILTIEHDQICTLDVSIRFPNCGHCPITFDYYFQLESPQISNVNPMSKFAWFKGKFNKFEQHIHDIDWHFEFYNLTVDAMMQCTLCRFQELITPLIGMYIPTKPTVPNHHSQTSPPSQLKKERARAWSIFKEVQQREGRCSPFTQLALDHFNSCNTHYHNFYTNYRVTHQQKLIDKLHTSPKYFRSHIYDKKKGILAIGSLCL